MKRKYLFEQDYAEFENLLLEVFVSNDNNPVSIDGKGKSILSIEVRTREGCNIPHFHYKKSNNKGGCIRIDKAEYFNHGDEYKYHGESLTKKEARILNIWLSQKYSTSEKVFEITNWEFIRDFWNNDINKSQVLLKNQPDYSLL